MSKRKLVNEIANGSDGEVKINDTFLNILFGDPKDELVGKLELGSTMLDITRGLKIVKQKKDDDCLIKYTIMLYITHSAFNNAVQFLEIESKLSQPEIIDILFQHLKYKLPGGKRLNKRKKDGIFSERKYFGKEDDFYLLEILKDHAYIYIGESDGKCYENNYISATEFVFRKEPEKNPMLYSII